MSLTTEQIFTFISIIIAFIGGFFALYKWSQSVKLRKAEYIGHIIEKLRFDKEMSETMYMIDYDKNWYNENFHSGTDGVEYKVDKLFSYLSYICYLSDSKHIGKKEFAFLEYELKRVCKSSNSQNYLWNLYHFSKKNNTPCSFEKLVEYGLENHIFNSEFENCQSTYYHQYLNF